MSEEETSTHKLLKEISRKLNPQPTQPPTQTYKCPGCSYETPDIQKYIEHRAADVYLKAKKDITEELTKQFTEEVKKLREQVEKPKTEKPKGGIFE